MPGLHFFNAAQVKCYVKEMNCKIKTDLGIIWVPQYNPVLGSMKTPGKIFFQILYQDITWPGAPQSRPPSGQASEQPDTSFSPPWKFHRYVNLLWASFWFTLLYLDSSVHPANAVEFIPEKTQEGCRPVGHLGFRTPVTQLPFSSLLTPVKSTLNHQCTMCLSPLKRCIKEFWQNVSFSSHFPAV